MIDTHAHLDFPEFDQDREEVVSRAFDNGVKKIINVGVDLERSRKSIEIAEKHEGVFASVGLHPDFFSKDGKEFSIFNLATPPLLPKKAKAYQFSNKSQIQNYKFKNTIKKLREVATHKKVVAIGETGLDYFHVTRNLKPKQGLERGKYETKDTINEIKERQKEGFLAQIELAQELNLPVIVHCREAWEDLYEIISNLDKSSTLSSPDYSSGDSSELSFVKFVLHCYSGDKADTEKFLELSNVYFSFSGNITYPKPADRAEKLAEAVRMIPLERIMLDSDSPFLSPQEFRGKRNEPSYVKYIAEKIVEVKKVSASEVEKVTDENARAFFKI